MVVPASGGPGGDLVPGESGLARKRKIQRACECHLSFYTSLALAGEKERGRRDASPNRSRAHTVTSIYFSSLLFHHRHILQLSTLEQRERTSDWDP